MEKFKLKEDDYIIEVYDLTISYQDKPVIWDNDLKITRGSRTAIIGPNGAGKSTLLKGILNLQKRLSGEVKIMGEDVKKVKKKIAYIPQSSEVNWDFPTTVFDVVLMGRYVHLGPVKRPTKKDREIADMAIEKIGLSDFKNRQISQLSGGQKQRAFIARSIAQDADIYFMDEPLAGVDKTTEKVIMDFLKESQEKGKTMVVVHHDLNTVREYFDHVILLNKKIIKYGHIDEVFNKKYLEETFGGVKINV